MQIYNYSMLDVSSLCKLTKSTEGRLTVDHGLKGELRLFLLKSCTNLLLVECEVRTASYGPSFFFLPFMAQARSTRAMKTRKEKKRGSITCRTDRANEANKMFIIWLCWLFRELERNETTWRFDRWSRDLIGAHKQSPTLQRFLIRACKSLTNHTVFQLQESLKELELNSNLYFMFQTLFAITTAITL